MDGGCGTMATALAAATAHSTWGRWQRTAAVELDAAGRTNGERLLLWTTVAAETAVAVPAVAVSVMAADSNWGRSCLWLGAVHILRKWQMAVSTEI